MVFHSINSGTKNLFIWSGDIDWVGIYISTFSVGRIYCKIGAESIILNHPYKSIHICNNPIVVALP